MYSVIKRKRKGGGIWKAEGMLHDGSSESFALGARANGLLSGATGWGWVGKTCGLQRSLQKFSAEWPF